MTDNIPLPSHQTPSWKVRLRKLYQEFKSLQGDPHFVAMGAAIGVFVAITPTIPLHTTIAVGLAFLFNCSKPAAAIAVWVSNPVTIPLFYYGSFKLGTWILGHELPISGQEITISQMLRMGWDVTVAAVVGGALLGIVPAIISYFLTLRLFQKIHLRRSLHKMAQAHVDPAGPRNADGGMPLSAGSDSGKKDDHS
ncbi:MAG: DUF2062 domain-containing protein [Desulfobacteraceae bacterium]|nr:DUF2062 domain-containing protein [Desulfobacteraceae bacterium]